MSCWPDGIGNDPYWSLVVCCYQYIASLFGFCVCAQYKDKDLGVVIVGNVVSGMGS